MHNPIQVVRTPVMLEERKKGENTGIEIWEEATSLKHHLPSCHTYINTHTNSQSQLDFDKILVAHSSVSVM